MTEIYKDVVGYEGWYKISDHGDVMSFVKCKSGNSQSVIWINDKGL